MAKWIKRDQKSRKKKFFSKKKFFEKLKKILDLGFHFIYFTINIHIKYFISLRSGLSQVAKISDLGEERFKPYSEV